jgi:hypothetical protein
MDVMSFPSASEKVHLWNQLRSSVASGRLGMVTMALETEDLPQKASKLEMDRKGNVIRMYCSGGVVEWVWSVLYIFGNKRVDGMIWFDAEDKAVIRF